MRNLIGLVVCAWIVNLVGVSQAPVVYDAIFSLPEGTLTGRVTFAVAADGTVSGTVTVPADGVDGRLGGTVTDGIWSVDITYTMTGRDCEGRVTGKAEIPADRRRITGKVMIGGSCTRPEKPATFELVRATGRSSAP